MTGERIELGYLKDIHLGVGPFLTGKIQRIKLRD
jgi:hypothetical protein